MLTAITENVELGRAFSLCCRVTELTLLSWIQVGKEVMLIIRCLLDCGTDSFLGELVC